MTKLNFIFRKLGNINFSSNMELLGPIRWPIFGSLFSLLGYKERTLMEWTKFYGPIYQLKLGSLDAVVFNGYVKIISYL